MLLLLWLFPPEVLVVPPLLKAPAAARGGVVARRWALLPRWLLLVLLALLLLSVGPARPLLLLARPPLPMPRGTSRMSATAPAGRRSSTEGMEGEARR